MEALNEEVRRDFLEAQARAILEANRFKSEGPPARSSARVCEIDGGKSDGVVLNTALTAIAEHWPVSRELPLRCMEEIQRYLVGE